MPLTMNDLATSQNFRLAHISDLHFSKICYSPSQFFSKRWIGNFNLLLRRAREFDHQQLFSLIDVFKRENIQYVVISGDLSTTSLAQEFNEAADFLDHFRYAGIEVFTLPGNHDHYTKQDYKNKTFYQFFDCDFAEEKEPFAHFNLRDHKIAVKKLKGNWWIVVLDTALPTSLLTCHGTFTEEVEARLKEVLSAIPEKDNIIVANHFPIFTCDSAHKHLVRDEALRNVLHSFKNVRFYLHGHTHRHCIADLRNAGLPIILESGSASHKREGSWNLLDFSPKQCEVQVFRWGTNAASSEPDWNLSSKASFEW